MDKVMMRFMLGLVLVFSTPVFLAAKSEAPGNGGSFTAQDKAFYLTDTQVAFIRPGLEAEILDIDIPADLMPLVTFSLKDPAGLPLDIDGITTPGPVDVRNMLTFIPQGEEQKVTYHDRLRDRDGTYTDLGDGVYSYKFTTVLPADFDMDATHTLALVARRDLREFDLDRYVSNQVLNFVPSGASEPVPRDIVTTATCNRCHDPLAEHGGRYQEVAVCAQCHNPGLSDGSVSMDIMIHRVHNELGNEFPPDINDCQVCHTGGMPTPDFPLVATPAPVPVCDRTPTGITTVDWLAEDMIKIRVATPTNPAGRVMSMGTKEGSITTGKWLKDGTVFSVVDQASDEVTQELPVNTTILGCAGNAPGTQRGIAGAQHTNWMTRTSRAVCTSCHTSVNFATGEGHSEFEIALENDDDCIVCHKPNSTEEYDRSITGAHTVDYKSAQLGGVLLQVEDIEFTMPGQNPRVKFGLSNKFGPLDPAELERLRFSISGPNDDFDYYVQDRNVLDNLVPSGKYWTYRFEDPLPLDASGSYTFGFEGRIGDVIINPGGPHEFDINDQAQNFTVPFAVTDADPVPRRMIVDDAKCENCHSNLSLHGSNRHNPEYCVTCHMPAATDVAQRDPDNMPPQAIHFKYLIHKLHRGADLENGYVVLGFNQSVHPYSDTEFPGDLRNCETCHVNDSYKLPLPMGLLNTVSPRDFLTEMQPETAACLSCHDGIITAAHADANTSVMLGESCANCHGSDKSFSVERVHAR